MSNLKDKLKIDDFIDLAKLSVHWEQQQSKS